MSKYTAEDFAQMIGTFRRQVAGLVRRMTVKLSDGGVWQVAGHLLFDNQREAPPAENYPGIGFVARPPANASAEVIVVNVGGQNQPAIVASRDEATRAKVADVVADEAAAYNTLSRVHVKADGTIEARTHAGNAVSLATKADLQALRDYVNNQFSATLGHVHVTPAGPTTTITTVAGAPVLVGPAAPTVVPANPAGTTKLKGE